MSGPEPLTKAQRRASAGPDSAFHVSAILLLL